MEFAGLLTDESPHFIDHLAPFCASVGCPLIVWENSLATDCRSFYPHLEVLETGELPSCIISCLTRPHLEQTLGLFRPHPSKVIWLPHGLSDKGWKQPFFEALSRENLLLVYGNRMREMLQRKKISIPQFSIGNFRQKYYQQNQTFYETLVAQEFGHHRFILYAPTWEDSEQNGSFWEAFPHFLNNVPSSVLLLIKLHPNTLRAHLPRLEQCRGAALRTPNIRFLDAFFPLYPLLERCDAYIGDMSSIGYDFLTLNKPLFFLRKELTDPAMDPSAFLMQAGEQVLIKHIPSLLQNLALLSKNESLADKRQSLLRQSFDSRPNWSSEFLLRIQSL
jgi:hypothetical protein